MALKHLRSMTGENRTDDEKLDDLRVRFLRLYPNLPLFERSSPCIVLDVNGKREPLSWNACYHEINAKTPLSRRILKWLGLMEFI